MISELRAISGPGQDLAAEVAVLFRRDATAQVERLKQAHQAGEQQAVHRIAHTLKGSAGNLGLVGLMAACHDLQVATQDPAAPLPTRAEVDRIAGALDSSLQHLTALGL